MKRGAIALVTLMAGCSFSPLAHRIDIGSDPFVVVAGRGADQNVDLFAGHVDGGDMYQFTFTPLIESEPAVTRLGDRVAFLRSRDTTTSPDVVVMNLLSGGEATLSLPGDAGRPRALAWADGDTALYVRTDRGVWTSAARPRAPAPTPVAPSARAHADSLLDLWLGTPRFTRAIGCPGGGLCVVGPRGDTGQLAPQGHAPMRWGSDSVAWFEGSQLVVRSLGPGAARRIHWTNSPDTIYAASYAAGPADMTRQTGDSQ